MLHILNTEGVKPLTTDKKLKEQYKQFVDYYSHDKLSQTVIVREILMTYDAARNEKERKEALEKLKKYCHWEDPSNYSKPTNMKKVSAAPEEGGNHSTDDEQEDEELKKYSSHFQYDEEFNRKVLIDSLIEANMAESIHPVTTNPPFNP